MTTQVHIVSRLFDTCWAATSQENKWTFLERILLRNLSKCFPPAKYKYLPNSIFNSIYQTQTQEQLRFRTNNIKDIKKGKNVHYNVYIFKSSSNLPVVNDQFLHLRIFFSSRSFFDTITMHREKKKKFFKKIRFPQRAHFIIYWSCEWRQLD